jgi:hypothetical protein
MSPDRCRSSRHVLRLVDEQPIQGLLDVTGPLQVFATANEIAASGSKCGPLSVDSVRVAAKAVSAPQQVMGADRTFQRQSDIQSDLQSNNQT